jgi:hypothetical protein
MIRFIHEIEKISEKYGLKIDVLDATDVTLMMRIEIMPSIFIQVYRNWKKNKLNMALILGNNRIYGVDSEGGITHEHLIENAESHVPIHNQPNIEAFILQSLGFLQTREII